MKRRLFFSLAILIWVAIASAGIYKWVDEEGVTHYSETPPSHQRAKEVQVAPPPPRQVIEEAKQKLEKSRARQRTREVLGTIVMSIAPTKGALLPKPPINLTLLIRSESEHKETEYRITDPSPGWVLGEEGKSASSYQNFSLLLPPGKYRLVALKVQAASLSASIFDLPTGGPAFIVPDADCVYVGRIGFSFARLPPGSEAEARIAAMSIAREHGRPLVMVYLPEGALIPAASALDVPSEVETSAGAKHSREHLDRARTKQCATQLASF